MRAVNLLPRDAEVGQSSSKKFPVVAIVACAAAVTVVAGIMGMQASSQADGRRADLDLTEAAIARIPVRTPQVAAPDVSVDRSNRITALQSALATRVPADKVLTELSYIVPEDVWLTGLTLSIPADAAVGATAAPATAGAALKATVTIKGATYSQPAIARFLARLSAVSTLDQARLAESARVEPQAEDAAAGATPKKNKPKRKQKVVITFTVTADLGGEARS